MSLFAFAISTLANLLRQFRISVLVSCLQGRVKGSLLGLVETRAQIGALLKLQGAIDLVIPRGGNSMVQVTLVLVYLLQKK